MSKSEIVFNNETRILALSADFAGSAGAVFGVSSWTELWGYRYENHVRLWEELTPVPNRHSLRIVDSYAGFSGDAPVLEPLWTRALAGERISDEWPIFSSGKLWALIDDGPEAQARYWLGDPATRAPYYAEQRQSLRPGTFARLHENRWQTGEEAFLTREDWDACVLDSLRPLQPHDKEPETLFVGVDAATKHDCAAVVAVVREGSRIRLVNHRIWTPKKNDPLNLERTIEAYLLELNERYRIRVFCDPYQMISSVQRLEDAGVNIAEYPQTPDRLTDMGQTLWELIKEKHLAMYPDPELRKHALNAIALETSRGWRIAKDKSSKKIDGVIALAIACVNAVRKYAPKGYVISAPRYSSDRVFRTGDLEFRGEIVERLHLIDKDPKGR